MSCTRTPDCRGGRARRAAHAEGQALDRLHPVLPGLARSAAARGAAARPQAARPARQAREGAHPVAGGARAGAGGRRAAARRRGGRARAHERVAGDGVQRLRRRPRRARTATAPRGSRPTCASAACRRASSRSGCPAERAGRRVPPPALLARLLPAGDPAPPAQRHGGVPASATAARSSGATPRRRFEAGPRGAPAIPLVDAGMRQLRREGWMHNRARLVVGLVPDQVPGRSTGAGASAGSCAC